MNGAIAELNRRFEIPGTAQVVEGNGGLPKVCITFPGVAGEMYLHGAQVPGSQRAEKRCCFPARGRNGTTAMQFVEAYQDVTPGLESKRTTR
jgi:hypothetical protein